jgi:GNAT superfamily N-acetyltransferase
MSNAVTTRTLNSDDLDAIVDIDERTGGVERRAFWEGKVLIQEGSRPPWTSRAAESDGQVIGFLFCHYDELEFGLPGITAWVDIIGVHPGYRRLGVAAKLMEDFTFSAEDLGIERIFTLVSEADHPDVGKFFNNQGFTEGRMKHFRKDLKGSSE